MTHCSDTTNLPGTARLSDRSSIRRLFDRLQAAHILYKQRKALISLDDAMLRDIGVTREQANSEANRPVWDAPKHWKV